MTRFDVFNGDADGLCAVQQWRLAHPTQSTLVTGVKRDIALLGRVNAAHGDEVAVFDISLEKNRAALEAMLAAGAQVVYFDHHNPGPLTAHPALCLTIDTSADICTSLLVNRHLHGRFARWAVVGAFGDNLAAAARREAEAEGLGLSEERLGLLRRLGECINYNAYGSSLEDLYMAPQDLFLKLHPYADPLDFIANEPQLVSGLIESYENDLSRAADLKPHEQDERVAVFFLPDLPWARRVSGVFANHLAEGHPERAHALLTEIAGGGYLVSVRAPQNRRSGADTLCLQFPTGGGRKGAAGINRLPASLLDTFLTRFRETYSG